jgi:hypothetical protein
MTPRRLPLSAAGLGLLAMLSVPVRALLEPELPNLPASDGPAPPWFGAPVTQPAGGLAALALVVAFVAAGRAAHLGWRAGRRWAVAGVVAAAACVLALGAA